MSYVLDVPSEVALFMNREPPQTLLIRGPPGSGKSTLAVALFHEYRHPKVFISSRVSREELFREYPGMARIAPAHIVEGTSGWDSLRETTRLMDHVRELVAEPHRDQDTRGLWMPDSLREALSLLVEGSPGMVVVDSWDALIERYVGSPALPTEGVPDRAELERLVLDQLGRAQTFLVLVAERTESTQLDYLVNGVLETGWKERNGRWERWLHLSKLRGTRINSRSYPFSLDGGKFQCIGPVEPGFLSRLNTPDPDPDPGSRNLWPGSRDFAEAFGRLPVGGVTLLEASTSVVNEAIRQVYAPILSQVLNTGGRVLDMLPPSIPVTEVRRSFRHLLADDRFARQVRVQPMAAFLEPGEDSHGIVLPPPRKTPDESGTLYPEAMRFLEGAPHEACNVVVVWMADGLQSPSDPGRQLGAGELQLQLLTHTRRARMHLVFVVPSDSGVLSAVRPIATIHIRLWGENGRVFLAGEQPSTPSFGLTMRDDGAGYRLLPIV